MAREHPASSSSIDASRRHTYRPLADLATICGDQLRIGDVNRTFARLMSPSSSTRPRLSLLDVKLGT
jgi:hypothetical protein